MSGGEHGDGSAEEPNEGAWNEETVEGQLEQLDEAGEGDEDGGSGEE